MAAEVRGFNMNTSYTRFVVALGALLVAAIVSFIALTWGSSASPAVQAGPAPTPTPYSAARQISVAGDLIAGPLSRGQIGDYYLANNKVQFVIQRPIRNLLNVGQYGGQIIDADRQRVGPDPERDNFEEFSFGINLENTAHYTSVSVINDGSNGQPAVIRATGVDDLLDFINPSSQVAGFGFPFPGAFDDVDLPITVSTDYTLGMNDNSVRIDTTVTNTDTVDQVETYFMEFIGASGELETFSSGYGFGEPLVTAACGLCNVFAWAGYDDAEGVSYGYFHNIANSTTFNTSGVSIALLGADAALSLIGAGTPNYIIPPNGGQVTATRYFAVGDGSVGSIIDIRNQVLGLTTGTLSGTVTRNGQPVQNADVTVLGAQVDGPGSTKNVVSHFETDVNGQYQGTLPPGNYNVQAALDGHLVASPDPAPVTITASMTTMQNFTVPEAGRVRVTVIDENSNPIAAKVSLVGFDPYVDPENFQLFLGSIENRTGVFSDVYADRMPYGLTHVEFAGQNGDTGELFVEPGSYQVVVSHGTEYSIAKQDITVTAGNLTTVNTQIARVLDTTGFISGDFHVHQLDSPDSKITYTKRLITMIAEGVDFFTPSDHEHRSDLGPAITALGIGGLISVAPNAETTSPDYGHFNAWPMTIDTNLPNGGAVDWAGAAPAGQDFPSYGNYSLTPDQIFSALLADPGTDTLQINHVDSFFGPEGLAIDTGMAPPQDFANNASKRLDPSVSNLWDDSFTALEIWQGTDRNDVNNRLIGRNMGDWFNLLNQGIVRSGIFDSDTHKRITSQAGFPRTMVASPSDDPSAIAAIAETIATDENAGRSFGTNGPFVRVTTSAASTGQAGGLALGLPTLISTTDGSATVTVDIQSPLWAPFDRVEYYVNSAQFGDNSDNNPATPPLYRIGPDAVQVAGTDFTVNTINDFPSIPGGSHLEATTSLTLNGLTQDTWVVVLVRGTDGHSQPIFPIVPNDLKQSTNTTLANLTDGNLGEDGVLAAALANPVFIDVNGDSDYDAPGLDLTPTADTDKDGCANAREASSKEVLGGRRDYMNFWDFFDVWTHPSGMPLAWERTKTVALSDIFAIAKRFAATGNPNGDPLIQPVNETGYHTAYDRIAPPPGADPWDLGAADGAIGLNEINQAAKQAFHNCV